jgi:hypothetical protein
MCAQRNKSHISVVISILAASLSSSLSSMVWAATTIRDRFGALCLTHVHAYKWTPLNKDARAAHQSRHNKRDWHSFSENKIYS